MTPKKSMVYNKRLVFEISEGEKLASTHPTNHQPLNAQSLHRTKQPPERPCQLGLK